MSFHTSACLKFDALNLKLVHREINFSQTVMFIAEIDLTEIEAIRSQLPKDQRPSYTAFVAKAVACSLKEYPYANRRLYRPFGFPFIWRYQNFHRPDIAIAIERNIENQFAVAYMEVLQEADTKTWQEITEDLQRFALTQEESSPQWESFSWAALKLPRLLQGLIISLPLWLPRLWTRYRGAASMISSPAKYGVDAVVTSWSHPLAFSFGLVQDKALVKQGQVQAVPAFTFCMNFDRRVMAGAQAARFFQHICKQLRQPLEGKPS